MHNSEYTKPGPAPDPLEIRPTPPQEIKQPEPGQSNPKPNDPNRKTDNIPPPFKRSSSQR